MFRNRINTLCRLRWLWAVVWVVASLAPVVHDAGAQPASAAGTAGATIATNTQLRDVPSLSGKSVAFAKAGTPIEILVIDKAWVRVRMAGVEGWVRISHITGNPATVAPTAAAPSAGPAAAAAGTPPRTGAVQVPSTAGSAGRVNPQVFSVTQGVAGAVTGAKGLTKEELGSAQPNPQEVARMEAYAADVAAAQRFASEGRLSNRTLALKLADGPKREDPVKGGR